jgi:hypothetical protein
MWHLDEGTIHAWLDGALSADEARRVEAHVGSCTACAEAVAEARGLIAASSRILTALDAVPGAGGARGARGAKGERRSLTTWLVRERIAAVVAIVVAGGALALVVSRNVTTPESIQTMAEPVAAFELTVAESPAPPPSAPSPSPERDGARPAPVTPRVAAREPDRDLAADRQAQPGAAAAPARLEEITVAQTDLARSQVRTDDTLRALSVAQAPRAEGRGASVEARPSAAEKLANALPGGRAGAVSARFAQPPAAEASITGLAAGVQRDARLVQEELMTESGREVRRRIYRVDSILVTLDERAPDTGAYERRRSAANAEAAQAPPLLKDSAAVATNTIRWTDARGAELTLTGPASPARLAEIRKLLGY